jgi:glycosyltransferase involved in cell wall biosynthesis
MNSYKISIIIPAYNEERYIAECLTAITSQSITHLINSVEVVVVDNGSTDNTISIAKKYNVKIIHSSADYVGGVRNDGVKETEGEILVFLDSDCVVSPTWLNSAVESLITSESSAVGGQYRLRSNPSIYEKYWVLNEPNTVVFSKTLIGGCLITWRAAFKKVDGFSETLTAGEDEDYSRKVMNLNGLKVFPKLDVIHLGFPNDFLGFWNRQIWHSSSYAQNLKSAFSQPTFLLLMLHVFLLLNFINVFVGIEIRLASLLLWLIVPAIFSFKRAIRASYLPKTPLDILGVYYLDFIYMIAREIGILKSIVKSTFNINIGKSRIK